MIPTSTAASRTPARARPFTPSSHQRRKPRSTSSSAMRWMGKQYVSHEAFIERWMAWAAPVVAIDAGGFPWRYPTAGGSEALFHVIAAYGNRARGERFNPEVHV